MAKKDIESLVGNQEDFSRWFKLADGRVRIGCCDCGLVHDFEMKISKSGIVKFRARVNAKHTKKRRKKQNIVFK